MSETEGDRPGDPVLVRSPDADAPASDDPDSRGSRSPGDGEGSVHVVGTAHVSEESVAEVRETIDRRRPDIVAVELDEGRHRQMQGEAPEDLEAGDLLRGNTVFQFLAYWMLSYVQSQLGERFDVDPGAEMKAAVEAAEAAGSGVALVDRDIQVTIQRFWARMTLPEKLRTVSALAFGVADPPVVAVTTALATGLLLGPPVAVAAFGAGVAGPTMARLVAGGLVGVGVGYLAFRAIGDTNTATAAGAGAGLLTGVAVAATGLGAGTVGSVVSGTVAYLLGGAAVALGVGLLVGTAVGLWLALSEEEMEDDPLDVEDLTDADVVTALIEEFRQFSPGGAEALIDERDAYIAHHLVGLRDQGYDVVAVVGAGHREGVEGYLADPSTLPPFADLVGREAGRRFSPYRAVGYLVSAAVVAFFGLLVLGGARDRFLLELFGAWFLFNGVFAFTLAKVAGARWTSAGVGGAVAWLTSVNPLLAPGWFAGYVELRYTTVNVADISRLNDILDDEEAPLRDLLGRMFDVPLFRLIMVVAMTNVGSMIATFLFPFVVLPLIAPGGDVGTVADLLLRGARNGLEILTGLVGAVPTVAAAAGTLPGVGPATLLAATPVDAAALADAITTATVIAVSTGGGPA